MEERTWQLVEEKLRTEEALTTALGAEVRVRLGRRGGTVEIPFEELSEVRALARRIGRDQAA